MKANVSSVIALEYCMTSFHVFRYIIGIEITRQFGGRAWENENPCYTNDSLGDSNNVGHAGRKMPKVWNTADWLGTT